MQLKKLVPLLIGLVVIWGAFPAKVKALDFYRQQAPINV